MSVCRALAHASVCWNALRAAACMLAFSIVASNFSHAANPAISSRDSHVLILKRDGTLWVAGDRGFASAFELPVLPGAAAMLPNHC